MTTLTGAVTQPTGSDPRSTSFVPAYYLASYGLYVAIFSATLGGVSVKVQGLVPLDQAAQQLGLITGLGAVFSILAQPITGAASDRTRWRHGMRRPWILAGALGTFVGLAGTGAAGDLASLTISFCAAQLFANMAHAAANATIADQVPAAHRGRVAGAVASCAPVSLLTAAVALSYLPSNFLRLTVPAGCAVVFCTWFALRLDDRVLPPPTRVSRQASGRASGRAWGRALWPALRRSFAFAPGSGRNLTWVWATRALIMLGFAGVGSYLTLYLAAQFQITDGTDQLRFAMYAIFIQTPCVVLAGHLGGQLADRTGHRRLLVCWGGLLIAAGIGIVAGAAVVGHDLGLATVLVGEAVIGVGVGLFLGVDLALAIEVLPDPARQAKDLAVLNTAASIPQVIAPVLGGLLVLPLMRDLAPDLAYPTWFGLSAVASAVGGLLVWKIDGVR
ncbi:MAG: MFS transporter [Nocardioides sp.]|uniref:MFS transporter n=1 Tax=Nocardioides sp. TaxID=35761 RepID=UPI0039E56098